MNGIMIFEIIVWLILIGFAIKIFIIVKNLFSIIMYPFKWIRMILTRTLPTSPNGCLLSGDVSYINNFNLIVFGIFGNIVYWGGLTILILSLFFLRPINDNTYIVKENEYKVEDIVKVDNNILSIEKVNKDNTYKLSNNSIVKKKEINGRVCEKGKFWILHSCFNGGKYTIDKSVKIIRNVESSLLNKK